jgi:hypothetical protein
MKHMLKNKYVWIAVAVGVITGNIIGVTFFKDKAGTGPADTSVLEIGVTEASPFLVRVSDQPAGPTVVVSEMKSSATSTWLAVREQNGDLLGQILGARRIDAPSATGISIELLRSTVPNLMYAVVLYADDGNGLFEYATDTPIKANSVALSYPFVAK